VAPELDLLDATAELVDIASVSGQEATLVEHLRSRLGGVAGLELTQVGDNLVARTQLGRSARLVLAGHTDTVPANGNERARLDGDVLHGLGSADMKGGLAVLLALAQGLRHPAVDVTFVFYAREEVAAERSGLLELARERPDLLVGDVALVGEPTAAAVEAGCQGTLRLRVTLAGQRAHPARPWMGRNAVHRAGPLLSAVAEAPSRRPVLEGCEFREALQVVAIEGGVADNVVPDRVVLTINHRFAPDHDAAQAEAAVHQVLDPFLEEGDSVEVVDVAVGAYPATAHPLVQALIERNDLTVGAKLGWTDVARFAELGIPGANFGPGDPTLAHSVDEHVSRQDLEAVHRALDDLIHRGLGAEPPPPPAP
jgi:succinyl-diaminopimelate desuccinylase